MLEIDAFKCALEKIKSEVNNEKILELYPKRLSKLPSIIEMKKDFKNINKYIESLIIFELLGTDYKTYRALFKGYENTFNPDTYDIIQSYVTRKDCFLSDFNVDENDYKYIKFRQFIWTNKSRWEQRKVLCENKRFDINGKTIEKECYLEQIVFSTLFITPTKIPNDFPKLYSPIHNTSGKSKLYYLKSDMDAWIKKHAYLRSAMKYELESFDQLYTQAQVSIVLRYSSNQTKRGDLIWRFDVKDLTFLSFISKEKYPYPTLEYKTINDEKNTFLGYEAFYSLWAALCKSKICVFNDMNLRKEFNDILLEKNLPIPDRFKNF